VELTKEQRERLQFLERIRACACHDCCAREPLRTLLAERRKRALQAAANIGVSKEGKDQAA